MSKEEHKAKKAKIKIEKNTVLLAAFLIVGLLIGGLVGFSLAPKQEESQANLTPTETGKTFDEAALKENVMKYLNDNILEVQGVSGTVTALEKVNDDIYSVAVSVKKEGEVAQEVIVYATSNGEAILIGNLLETDKPLNLEKPEPEKPQEFTKTDTPDVKLFVMSYCPYGQDAETAMNPVAKLLKENIEFEPHYVVYGNYCGYGVKCKATEEEKQAGYKEDSTKRAEYCFDADKEIPQYCSMHGINEVREDLRQIVIQKYFKDKWWAYVSYVNANTSTADIETKWKDAANNAGIDANKIQEYFDTEALDLLKAEFALNEKYSVQGSPTTIINEEEYSGQRSANALKTAICSAFKAQPADCNEIVQEAQAHTATTGGCG